MSDATANADSMQPGRDSHQGWESQQGWDTHPGLGAHTINWAENLRFGIWPKPLAFWAVVFYIALFILRPWEVLFPELGEIRFELLAVAALGRFVLLRRGPMVRVTAQNISMVALFASVWLSGRNAWDPVLSHEEVVEFFGFLLIFFFIQKAVTTPYQALFIVASYVMLTTAYVGKSLWEYMFHGAANYMMGVYRLAGIENTYGHPNTMATSMLCSLPFAIYFYRIRDEFCKTWPRQLRKLFPWVLRFHIVACVIGVVLTQSRSAVVGLVFYAGIIVLRKRGLAKKLKWGMLACVVFAVGFLFAPSDVQQRISTLWDASVEDRTGQGGANASAAGRWEGFVAGVDIYQRFPVSGVGIGNFAVYRGLHVDQVELDAHNLPGELLGELGTVGTLAFTAFFLAHFFTLRRLKKAGNEYLQVTGNQTYYWLAIALWDGLLLLMFSGLSGHNLQQYQWYFYAGFAVTCLYFVKQELQNAQVLAAQESVMQEEATDSGQPVAAGFDNVDMTSPYEAPKHA